MCMGKFTLFLSIDLSMELTAKLASCETAIKPIPIITKQTRDSIIESPLIELNFFILCNKKSKIKLPFCSDLV